MKSKLVVFDLDDTLIDTHGRPNSERGLEGLEGLELLDGVKELLLGFPVRKILVTIEKTKDLQRAKLDKLDIFDLFEDVLICDSKEGKRDCFREIAKKNEGIEIWTVGDRIDSEIRYANELRWKSVLIKRGKYRDLEAQNDLEIPDYVINNFIELRDLLK